MEAMQGVMNDEIAVLHPAAAEKNQRVRPPSYYRWLEKTHDAAAARVERRLRRLTRCRNCGIECSVCQMNNKCCLQE